MSMLEDVTIIKHKKEVNYTTVYNDCINDQRLNTNCLGVLLYVMSKPDDFKIIVKNISNRFDMGRDRVYNTINDLISYGYMKRSKFRRKDGTISKIVIYASDKPIFKKESHKYLSNINTKHQLPENQEVDEYNKTNKQPLPDLPDVDFQEVVPYIQNKDIYKETTTTNLGIGNTDQDRHSQTPPVVVFLIDKIRNLPNFDVSEEQMNSWVKDYGHSYVDEKIELMKAQKKVSSIGGYLRTALKHDWKIPSKSSLPEKKEIDIQKTQESNEALYDKVWFDSLPAEEKTKIYEGAKKAWPCIDEAIKLSKTDFNCPEFSKSAWFKPMVDAYRSYYRL